MAPTTQAATNQDIAQATAQGNALQNTYNQQAAQQYGAYQSSQNQANQANQNLANYNANIVNPTQYYNQELGSQEAQNGYDPNQMAAANKSLFGLTGALNAASNQFGTPGGVGAYGMSAPALAGYESSILSPLQTGVSNANTQVNTLNNQYQNYTTAANQYATLGLQGEQLKSQNYQSLYSQSVAQLQSTGQTLAAIEALQQQQGYLTAEQVNQYQTAYNGYISAQASATQAQAAMIQANAQAPYYAAQTTGQNLTNTGLQNQLNSQAAKAQSEAQNASNKEYNAMTYGNQPSSSNKSALSSLLGIFG